MKAAPPRSFDPFLLLLEAHGLPAPVTEWVFAPPRKWRADYAWVDQKVIVEKQGGVYRGGRRGGTKLGGHSSVQGLRRDWEKATAAQLAGFLYLQFTPQQLDSGEVLPTLTRILAMRTPPGVSSPAVTRVTA
jgi:hypothetical protein